MRHTSFNFWLDVVLTFNFIALSFTGAVLRWAVACGWGCREAEFWGWSRGEWIDLHFWLAVLLFVNVAGHLYFHWDWIVTQIKKRWFR
jgi:hypothetical protein